MSEYNDYDDLTPQLTKALTEIVTKISTGLGGGTYQPKGSTDRMDSAVQKYTAAYSGMATYNGSKTHGFSIDVEVSDGYDDLVKRLKNKMSPQTATNASTTGKK